MASGKHVLGILSAWLTLSLSALSAAELVWADVSYTDGSLTSPTYTVDGVDINLTVTGDTGFFVNTTPKISTKNQGGFPSGTESLELTLRYTDNVQFVVIEVTFDELVQDVSFTLFDIDVGGSQGGGNFSFVDQVTLTAIDENDNTINPTTLTGSPNNMVVGNVVTGTTGTPNSGPNSGQANATVTFDGPIKSFSFIYGNGPNVPVGPGFPTEQAISLYDISFTPVIPEPEVYAAAAFLFFCLTGHWWQRRRGKPTSPVPVSSQG